MGSIGSTLFCVGIVDFTLAWWGGISLFVYLCELYSFNKGIALFGRSTCSSLETTEIYVFSVISFGKQVFVLVFTLVCCCGISSGRCVATREEILMQQLRQPPITTSNDLPPIASAQFLHTVEL